MAYPPGQQYPPQQPGQPQQVPPGFMQQAGPPPGYPPQPGWTPPPPGPPRRKRTGLKVLLAIVGGFVAIGIIGSVFSSGNTTGAASSATSQKPLPNLGPTTDPTTDGSVMPNPNASTAPAITPVRTVKKVLFVVTGTAPGGADITYGTDSDNRSPQGGLGIDGSGTAVPWTGSVKLDPNALYYDVSAQLQGSGDITCKVRVKVTVYFNDGTHRSKSKTLASGHASGGYNICDAQSS